MEIEGHSKPGRSHIPHVTDFKMLLLFLKEGFLSHFLPYRITFSCQPRLHGALQPQEAMLGRREQEKRFINTCFPKEQAGLMSHAHFLANSPSNRETWSNVVKVEAKDLIGGSAKLFSGGGSWETRLQEPQALVH